MLGYLGRAAIAVPATAALATIARPGTALAATQLKTAPKLLSVKNYGAKGNGVADDTAAIVKALAAGRNKSNTVVYFPAGTYVVSQPLVVSGAVTIAGQSAATTRLLLRSAWSLVVISNTASVSISNLTFDGANTPSSYGAWIDDANHIALSGCQFVNLSTNGISLQRVSNVTVSNSVFQNIGCSGVRLEDPGDANSNSYVYVQGCAFANVVTSGISGHAAVQTHDNPKATQQYVWVQNNSVQSQGVGLGLDALDHGTVTGNRIVGNAVKGEGIAFTGSNNLISGNTINNAAAAGILQWAVNYRSNDGNTITGNTCYDNAQGIAVVCGGAGAVVRNVAITRNRCYSQSPTHPQKWGVQNYLDGTSSFSWVNVQITNNDLRGNTVGPISIVPPASATIAANQG